MSSKPSSSTLYRNTNAQNVDVDDDDDFDDLDDVLASFNAPRSDLEAPRSADISGIPPPPLNAPTARPLQTASAPPPAEAEEDFEASLVEGMESLLRQLAGDHPPGPMPDIVPPPPASHPNGTTSAPLEKNGEGQMSAEEEEKAWQKAVEMMLSGQGLEALGLEKNGERSSTPPAPRNRDGGVKPDFQETIRRTMESLNQPVSSGSKGGGSGSTEEPGNATNLAALLGKFGSDPSALDGLGGDDDELGGLLDGMMTQRVILDPFYPSPLLAVRTGNAHIAYPAYLASPPTTVSQPDLHKYRQQHRLVQQILDTFRRPGYSDEKDGKDISKLVGEMQDLGGPPKEIMGDLPEGFDLGALGGEDACMIM
ncbi:MAG: Peroxisome chaperone and import receptor [Tremellales sp. Tagirdzhanova-0007]|nr:MAG: Peroxisome chaperone and import receptor [Tremellales sp. Tagirdzhanova-0007]